jgi:hypothetical protein
MRFYAIVVAKFTANKNYKWLKRRKLVATNDIVSSHEAGFREGYSSTQICIWKHVG